MRGEEESKFRATFGGKTGHEVGTTFFNGDDFGFGSEFLELLLQKEGDVFFSDVRCAWEAIGIDAWNGNEVGKELSGGRKGRLGHERFCRDGREGVTEKRVFFTR